MTSERPLTLHESASLLGRCRYAELGLFAALGRRAGQARLAPCTVLFAGASRLHGFHAALLEARLPVSVGLPSVEECTVAPNEAVERVLRLLEESEDGDVLDALSGAVYPSMAAGYASHLAICSPAADPPVARLLNRLLADLDALRHETASLLGVSGLATSGLARRVEADLAAAGGFHGPLRLAIA